MRQVWRSRQKLRQEVDRSSVLGQYKHMLNARASHQIADGDKGRQDNRYMASNPRIESAQPVR